jgi:DnaK suppressor protein
LAQETAVAYLNDEQLQQIQDLLSRREAQLLAEVRGVKKSLAQATDAAGREVEDAADQGENRLLSGLDHVQLLRDQEELREIDEARERIRRGRYGYCIECGEPIGLQRLLVQPTAKFCLVHEAEWEKKHPAAPRFTV